MGWDITYHPFGVNEVRDLYFAGVDTPDAVAAMAERFQVPEVDRPRLEFIFERARDTDPELPFPQTHAFFMAITAGFLRPYWYIRDGALSFLYDDPEFRPFFSDWTDLVPESRRREGLDTLLLCNYCGGVYLTPEALADLREAARTRAPVAEKLEALFSGGRLDLFWSAVDHALDNGLGLLEAAEVIEPNPVDVRKTRCYARTENCDPAGPILYQRDYLAEMDRLRRKKAEEDARKGVVRRLLDRIVYRP